VGEIGHVAHKVNTAVHINHAVDVYNRQPSGTGGSPQAPAQGGDDPLQTGTGRLDN
jgi:hypothetical protein